MNLGCSNAKKSTVTATVTGRFQSIAIAARLASLVSLATCCLIASSDTVSAADWPQWRGIKRNGYSYEAGWMTNWPPTIVWWTNIGYGFSSMVVSEGRLYTAGYTTSGGNSNIVYCLDAVTGTQLWIRASSYVARDGGYPGPRGTPVVDGNRVFFFDTAGRLSCLDKVTGTNVWATTLDTGRVTPGDTDWGYSSSPLVEGDLVIVNSGKGAAANKYTGAIVWTNSGNAGYASPVPYTATNGERMVVMFSSDSLNGLVATNGKRVWTYPWGTSYACHAGDPVLYGSSNVYISTGYSDGLQALVPIATGTVSHVWRNNNLKYRTGSTILAGDYIYGIDCDSGGLKCVDVRNGTVKWTRTGFSEGAITAADERLLVLDGGNLTIVKVTHTNYVVLGAAVSVTGSGECRTPPVLSNGRIYCRQQARIICFRAGPIPENDGDKDGIPDVWEQKHFTTTNNCQPSADSDGDGVSNKDEYLAGTDPTNAQSCLKMTMTNNNGKLTFTMPTTKAEGTGYFCRARFYSMEYATSLTGSAWSPAPDCMTIVGTNAPISYTNTPSDPRKFYRMKVNLE